MFSVHNFIISLVNVYYVVDVKCFPSGSGVPLISKSFNRSIVEGELVTFSCTFGGNFDPVDYIVWWSVETQNGDIPYIDDETSTNGFDVTKPQRDCPRSNYSCCRFTTELTVHSNMSLNKAEIQCHAIVLEQQTDGTSYLSEFLLFENCFKIVLLI